MYEAHFGLSGPPFQLNPDPSFYFNSKGHGHALAYLRYGVMQGEGFIVVTGEIGAGKTTLLRTLLDELDRAQVVAAQIVSTQLESGDLLQAIITAFGIPSNGSTKATLISTLEAFLMTLATQGRRALLVIDEAQNLEIRAIEELRMLSNFQLGTQSLLQSFLVGQPELRKKLESPEMEQLRQRVTASCHLGPLTAQETRGYVEHRLRRVGWQHRPAITDGAFDQIFRWSGGVPRRINRLANRLLLASFLEGKETIESQLVEQTAEELRREIGESSFEPVPLPVKSAVVEPVTPQATPRVDVDAAAVADRVEETPVSAPLPAQMAEAAPQTHGVEEPAAQSAFAATEVEAAQPVPAPDDEPVQAVSQREAPLPDAEPVETSAVSTAVQGESNVPVDLPLPPAVVEVVRQAMEANTPVLLGIAETTGGALKLASVAKALAAAPAGAPRVVLFNPGRATTLWPWDEMGSSLPAFPVEWHAGLRAGAFGDGAAALSRALDRVLQHQAPLAALVVGDGDAVLSCALMAKKRGLPVVRLDAGVRAAGAADEALNAGLIEQVSDLLFVPAQPVKMQRLYRSGIEGQRIHAAPAPLAVDVLNAALPLMTTPYGAFLRHRLPIFLGPRWSSEVEGTAYAVVSLRLDPSQPQRAAALLDVLVNAHVLPKLVWLTDAPTRLAVQQWQATSPEHAQEVFVIHEAMDRTDLDRRNSARILCADIGSLPDYLSVLRGAAGVLCQPGHVLADVAQLLGVPALLLADDCLTLSRVLDGEREQCPWSEAALNETLATWLSAGEPPSPTSSLLTPAGASAVIARRLMAWLAESVMPKRTSDANPATNDDALASTIPLTAAAA